MKKSILALCLLFIFTLAACNKQENKEQIDNIDETNIIIENNTNSKEDDQIIPLIDALDNEDNSQENIVKENNEAPTMKMRILDNQSEEDIQETTRTTCKNLWWEWIENDWMCVMEDWTVIYF